MVSITASAARAPAVRHPGFWRLTSALVLVVVSVSIALVGLITGPGWWVAMLFTASLILVSGAGLRTLGVRTQLVPLLLVVEWMIIMMIGFGSGTGLLGIIPTPATVARFSALGAQAMTSIYEQGTPAPPLPEFMFLVVAGSCALAIVLDLTAIAFRAPALAAIGMLAVLVVPAAMLGNGIGPLPLALCAGSFLYLLRADTRTRQPYAARFGAGKWLAAISLGLALLIASTAPGFTSGGASSFTAGGGISIGGTVSPLVDLGRDLRRPTSVTVLRYSTTAATAPYLKLASLDQFTGAVWKHRERDTKRLPPGNTIGPVPGLSRAVKTQQVTTSVTIADMLSRWLPVPFPVAGVRGLSGTWSWDPDDLTVGGVNATTQGQSYIATSVVLQPTALQLQDAGATVPAAIQRDLVLPANLPAVIAATARQATATSVSEYDKAVALQDYFRNNDFTYSVDTPLKQGFDGDGASVIAKFLAVKSGYCVHFASAMALMARTLGIPSRIAEGYLPGTSTSSTARNIFTYTVTSDDLHAWPELYFDGVGWVAFEPTVGRGAIPAYTRPDLAPSAGAAAGATGGASAKPSGPTNSGPFSGTSSANTGAAAQPVASVLTGFGALALIVLVPGAVRRWRRHARLRSMADARAPATLAWQELRDSARDLGWPADETETARAFAAGLIAFLTDAARTREMSARDSVVAQRGAAAVQVLLDAVERESYGPPGSAAPQATPADLRVAIDGLARCSGRLERIRAAFVPLSLFARLQGAAPGVSESRA